MESSSLTTMSDELLDAARASSSGRAARTLHGGHQHTLRQTVIAIAAGRALDDHESPGEATVQVLRGEVRLRSGVDETVGTSGDLMIVPPTRHALAADTDAVVLLTVVKAIAD